MTKTEALNKLMALCSQREYCRQDICDKLYKWKTDKHDQEWILDALTADNFIDNKRYAMAAAKDKFRFNKWGKIKIIWFLKSKNIEDMYIQSAINELDESEYRNMIQHLVIQKNKQVKEPDAYKRRVKVLRFVCSKGFEPDVASEVYSQISSGSSS